VARQFLDQDPLFGVPNPFLGGFLGETSPQSWTQNAAFLTKCPKSPYFLVMKLPVLLKNATFATKIAQFCRPKISQKCSKSWKCLKSKEKTHSEMAKNAQNAQK
jgi:hypothetical protein